MTDEKICPIMSRPVYYAGAKTSFISGMIECKKERCVAWGAKIETCPNCPEGDWVDGCRLIP